MILLNLILNALHNFIKDMLNPDEYANSKRSLFTNIYNFILTVIVNTDLSQVKDKQLVKECNLLINKIFD